MKGQARTTPVFAFDHQMPAELKSRFDEINQAILEQSVLEIEYRAAEERNQPKTDRAAWRFIIGAEPGPWPPGVVCDRISARFA